MKCPACDTEMEEVIVENIAVDVCKQGCGGIWFDQFELQKVDEPHESAGENLLQIGIERKATTDHSKKRMCPKCNDMVIFRHRRQVLDPIDLFPILQRCHHHYYPNHQIQSHYFYRYQHNRYH